MKIWIFALALGLAGSYGCTRNHPPIITSAWFTQVLLSSPETYVLQVNAADEDGDALVFSWTCSFGDFPDGNRLEKVRWQPPLSVKNKEYQIIVSASDMEFTVSDTLEIHVEGAYAYTDLRDGQIYPLVRIGTQTWMAANMNYETAWGSRCYGNDTSFCNLYGRLYEWESAIGVCPDGWHLPTMDEWLSLFERVSPHPGIKLKSQTGWYENGNGSDSFGFNLLPSGRWRWFESEGFGHIGRHASIWASDETDQSSARYVRFDYYGEDAYTYTSDKWAGFSVRCIQNQ